MVVTLKIKLGSYWSADIEFVDFSTLEDVHEAIQQAVDFDNDHLYAFFVARNEHAQAKVTYDDENGGIFETRIRDVFPLPAKQFLFYLFDYGDCWTFKIMKSRKKEREPEDGVSYPRLVTETGKKPIQYDFDDDDY